MMKRFPLLVSLAGLLFFSCQKEYSVEGGNNAPSVGSLQAAGTGDCLGITLSGTYKKDSSLNATHYIEVNVIVTTPGSYTITSDTLNGYYFRTTGTFSAAGTAKVRLQGTGKPLNAGTNSFKVTYSGTVCTFIVTVVPPAGSGGTAVFSLNGSPGNCTGAVPAGTYVAGTALTSANTVSIQVNVTTAGTYTITTASVNGITFTGSGTFAGPGAQTIILTGSGTPAAAGTFPVALTAGSTNCSFNLVVTATVALDYFPRTTNSNWSYEIDDDPADTLFRQVIAATHTALGNTYNIFVVANGSGFDSSGYYRKAGGDYYEFLDIGDYIGFDSALWVENIFLKDNVAAGTAWNTASYTGQVSGIPYTIRIKRSILQKDVTVGIDGVNYPNTIVVEEKYEALNAGIWIVLTSLLGYVRSYYSRNIGFIKLEFYDASNAIDAKLEMKRYTVF